ncbi:MAG: tyrosine-type recombinase/integrase [Dehalococcoidales bacterium]
MVQAQTSLEWLLAGFKYDLESTTRPKTVKYYCGEISRFLQWVDAAGVPSDIRLLTKHHIQAFFHHLITIGGDGSVNEPVAIERLRWPYYRALRRFFGWAVNEGYLQNSPMEDIKLKAPQLTPIEPYRPEHISRILKALDYDSQIAKTQRQKMLSARNRAVFLLFLESGLRLEELARLRLEDIDLGRRRVVIRHGKMGKSRLSGFGPQTRKALWKYLSLRPQQINHDALWITEEGAPLTIGGVQMIIRRLKKDAGLQHVKGSVHKLRHTFATTYLRHTCDMKGCRLLLGHSTLAMTERYTQFIEVEDALKAYDEKGPLDWIKG